MENDELAVEIREMLEEIFHNYLCYFNVEGCIAYRLEYSNQEKKKIVAHMDLNQDCSFGFVNLKGSDFQKLLSDLVHIIQTHNEEYIKDTQAAFKQFMRNYELDWWGWYYRDGHCHSTGAENRWYEAF